MVFTEKALDLLATGGIASFIQSHKFLNAEYGRPLREVLSAGRNVAHLVHFGDHQVFPQVTNYVCLLFLTPAANASFRFSKVEDLEKWYLNFSATEGKFETSVLTPEPWNLSVGRGAHVFTKLRSIPRTLGDVADVFVGLQTSADDVFIMPLVRESEAAITLESKALKGSCEFEKELMHSLISGTDVRPYAPLPDRQFILFPYRIQGGKAELIPLGEIEKRLPLTGHYLRKNRDRLEARESGKLHGTKQWHGYIYLKNMARQSLPKICVPRLVATLSAALDTDGTHYLDNVDVGGLTLNPGSNDFDLPVVLALLNSTVLRWFFPLISAPFRGGYFSANKQFLTKVPIPDIDETQKSVIGHLVEYMLWLRRHGGENAKVSEGADWKLIAGYFEQLVNAMVNELFFPGPLHQAGLHFFDMGVAAALKPLSEIRPGRELVELRAKFEELYVPSHPLRQGLYALDSIEEVRIIEGKA